MFLYKCCKTIAHFIKYLLLQKMRQCFTFYSYPIVKAYSMYSSLCINVCYISSSVSISVLMFMNGVNISKVEKKKLYFVILPCLMA